MRWRVLLILGTAIPFVVECATGMAAAKDSNQNLQAVLTDAASAQARRDFVAAAQAYRKAAAIDPSIPELWANLGLMDHESGNHAEAIESFRRAIRLNATLFVPQLFLGIELLDEKKPQAAIPYLEAAIRLNPKDVQAARSLAQAEALRGNSDRAIEVYAKVVQLAPTEGNSWFDLGTSYLQQVENDARAMTSTYGENAYVRLRSAEVLAEEGKLNLAVEAYRSAIASPSFVPCRFAEYGITLLRKGDTSAGQRQFELENRSGSHCGLTSLGVAVAELATGDPDSAARQLLSIANNDPSLLRTNLPLFRDAVSVEQVKSLEETIKKQANTAAIDLMALLEESLLSDGPPAALSALPDTKPSSSTPPPANAEQLYASERYVDCVASLKPDVERATSQQLQLLAICAFLEGDFQATSVAGRRMKSNLETRVQGLYWESKADQELAVGALGRAGAIDADSPRMHVLLGDVFRQGHRWEEADAEYRKAVALDPKSHSAQLSLAITLFAETKADAALSLDRSILAEEPDNPEANLLEGEILVQLNRFSEAERSLRWCPSLKPELQPRCHALLGRVYAETDRTTAAISEYKLGLATDEDGSIHYQLGRLYRKSGNTAAANDAFKEARRREDRKTDQERIALGQSSNDQSSQ